MCGMHRGCDCCQIKGVWISLNHSVPAGKYSLTVIVLGVSLNTTAACRRTARGFLPTSPPKASKAGENFYLKTCLEAGREWGVAIQESRG